MALMVPLPATIRNLASQVTHPGLFLDKYVASWDPQAEAGKLSERVQRPAVKAVTERSQKPPDGLNFGDLFERWQRMLGRVGCVGFRAKTVGPLTLHLARASALENAGICLHPIYGFVYMPGSGLKGMARSFAETVWLPAQLAQSGQDWQSADEQQWNSALDKLDHVFGYVPYIEPSKEARQQMSEFARELDRRRRERDKKRSQEANAHVGEIVFYDAWPVGWPRLVVDILNSHHKSYYENQEPPGDWDSPVPVYFLAVPAGHTFQFALGKWRDTTPDELLELAVGWLMGALEHQGAGAKTAAGYGAFEITEGPERLAPAAPEGVPAAKAPQKINQEKCRQVPSHAWQEAKNKNLRCEFTCTLELVTPAFLAGAEQQAEDCDLRPATLRGLLRWWWRTMHAGYVDTKTLYALESAVWGNTSQGGAVRITLRPLSKITRLYNKEDVKGANHLPSPPDKKTTPGLWYFSFGMDDIRKENGTKCRFQRYYVAPGAQWELRFTIHPSWYQIGDQKGNLNRVISLPNTLMLLQQAQAALWLLCQYGAVGSKSRKGYGCFATPRELGPLNLQQCKNWAEEFRQACGLRRGSSSGTPHLEDMLHQEIPTEWKNYWFVLDRIGAAAQEFAKNYKHNVEKKALGLPRKIGPPPRGSFTPGRHVQQTDRHASPIIYHVLRKTDGAYSIRMVAFPSPELPEDPTRKKSREFLQKVCQNISKILQTWTKDAEFRSVGQIPPSVPVQKSPPSGSHSMQGRSQGTATLTAGDRVEVTIVPDPKGRGRLFGRHEPTGLVGPIQNADRLPTRPQIGDRLTVQVASLSATGDAVQFKVPESSPK